MHMSTGIQVNDRGLSDHTGDSDNNHSFWHHSDIRNGRNIIFWEGILRVKANSIVGILTNRHFMSEFIRSAGGHGIHRCSSQNKSAFKADCANHASLKLASMIMTFQKLHL